MPRNVWVLSLIAFLIAIGFGVMLPVLPVFARSFQISQFQVGAVISFFALARLLIAPMCGRWTKLLGERTALGCGTIVVALSTAAAGLSVSYTQLLVLRGIGGVGSALFTVASMSLLLASVEPHQFGRASALYSGGFVIGGMAGPAVGGALTAVSVRVPFFFYAATLLVASIVGLTLLSGTRQAWSGKKSPPAIKLADAWKEQRYRLACAANFSVGWQAQGVRSTLVPLLVVEVLDRPPTLTGITMACAAIVQALALQPAGRMVDTWGRRPMLTTGLAICAITSLLIPFAPDIEWLIVIMCLFGVGAAFMSTAPTALIGDVIGGTGGTPVAVFQMSSDLGMIIGPLAAGALADHFSLPIAFGAGAVIMAVTSGWSLSARRTADADGPGSSALSQ